MIVWAKAYGLPGTGGWSVDGADPVHVVHELAEDFVRWAALTATLMTGGTPFRARIGGLGGPDPGPTLRHPLAVSERNRKLDERTRDIHLALKCRLHQPDDGPRECRLQAEAELGLPEQEDRRPPAVAARHLALGSMAQSVTEKLNKLVVVGAMPVLSGDDIGIRATLVARGPLGAGYLWLLEHMSIYTDDPATPYHWRQPRTCARVGCGREFVPRTKGSRFCRAACRVAAHRDRQRVLASE